MKLSFAVACAAATATCATAVVLSGVPTASAATKPKSWTVEYEIPGELIFVTYQYPQHDAKKFFVPLVLNRSNTQHATQQDMTQALRSYEIVPGDGVSVVVMQLRPVACKPQPKLRPLFRIHWKHVRLETGFGGEASSVAKHHPLP
jgi:hypothetical protein